LACRPCGDCCDPILLRSTKRQIRADRSLEGDEYILRHWRRISKESAFRKRPILRESRHQGRFYYLCDAFDSATRRCQAHDVRPPICRAFPNNLRVEGRPLRLRSYPNCGYNEPPAGSGGRAAWSASTPLRSAPARRSVR